MRFADLLQLLSLLGFLGGCGGMMDDLNPSATDKRPVVQAGITGSAVGQRAPDFTLPNSFGKALSLSSALVSTHGVVLYFTMWCPICDVDMGKIRSDIAPVRPDVRFYLVDYVSGSVAGAREAQVSNGYAGPPFTVLADTAQAVLGSYDATMGTTVVIDSAGFIRMSEDFKDGARLLDVLGRLP